MLDTSRVSSYRAVNPLASQLTQALMGLAVGGFVCSALEADQSDSHLKGTHAGSLRGASNISFSDVQILQPSQHVSFDPRHLMAGALGVGLVVWMASLTNARASETSISSLGQSVSTLELEQATEAESPQTVQTSAPAGVRSTTGSLNVSPLRFIGFSVLASALMGSGVVAGIALADHFSQNWQEQQSDAFPQAARAARGLMGASGGALGVVGAALTDRLACGLDTGVVGLPSLVFSSLMTAGLVLATGLSLNGMSQGTEPEEAIASSFAIAGITSMALLIAYQFRVLLWGFCSGPCQ